MKKRTMAEMKPRNVSGDPFSPFGRGRPTSQIPVLQKEKLTVGTFLGCACGVSLAAVIGIMAWFAAYRSIKRDDTSSTNTSFCCPNEAAKLFAVIDQQQEPCTDFYAYVCKNAIEQGLVKYNVMSDVLSDITGNIMKGTNYYRSEAAEALHALYTSCIREIWQHKKIIRDASAAVLEIANATSRMSGADLLYLAVAVNKRYGLTFLFEIRTSDDAATKLTFLCKNYLLDDYGESCDSSCYVHALPILNGYFGTNYTERDLKNWEETFLATDFILSPMSWTDLREAFGNLEASQFKAIFQEFFIDIDTIKSINVMSKTSFLEDIRLVTDARNQPMSVFYKMALLVLDAMRYIQEDKPLGSPTVTSEMVCNNHVHHSAQLWRVTYVAALANPAKDRQLHDIFEATRTTVSNYAPFRNLVAAGNDTEQFLALMKNFSLMLPTDLIFREPAVPSIPKQGFVRNLFLARKYEFDSKMQKVRRGMPPLRDDGKGEIKQRMFFINETTLYVSSFGYGWLSAGTTDPMLTDAAVFATRLAVRLSVNIFNSDAWSQKTKEALQYYRDCVTITSSAAVPEFVRPVVDMYRHGLRIAALVGTGGTGNSEAMTPASARSSWYTVQRAWSLFRISEAQFFYARFAYYYCNTFEHRYINDIVKVNADFSTAFHCSRTEDMDEEDCTNVKRKIVY